MAFELPHLLPMLLRRQALVAVVAGSLLPSLDFVAATTSYPNPKPQGNSWAPCSFAADQISAEGNGSTYGSCLGCNPTSFVCPAKCQSLINALYKQCDGVWAPQDHYFDPAQTLNGYWNDNMATLRVDAARCGCNNATRVFVLWTTAIAIAVASAVIV